MGTRFRKSFSSGPFRLNISKSGVGYSVGMKYYRVTKKANGGMRTTDTLSGTGISHVKDYSAAQVNAAEVKTAESAAPEKTENENKLPAWATAALVFLALFAFAVILPRVSSLSSAEKPSPSAAPAPVQAEAGAPVDYSSIEACFTSAFPDAETVCMANGATPQVSVKMALSSDVQPQNWTQILDDFTVALFNADAASKDLSRGTAFGQLIAADGTIIASGYNGKLQFDAFAEKPADTSTAGSRTVYVTPTGKKYHYSSSCNGGSYSAVTLDNALARGLTACEKCA